MGTVSQQRRMMLGELPMAPMKNELELIGDMLKKSEEEEEAMQSSQAYSPADIGPPKAAAKPAAKAQKDPNAIWDEDSSEVPVSGLLDDSDDGRKRPEYEFIYKQLVSSEDVYLGMDPTREPSLASADCLLVRVQLPGTKLADIQLDVKRQYLSVQAPDFKLATHLPQPVDDEKGNAKWDSDKCTLSVTLPIIRDWDEITSRMDQ